MELNKKYIYVCDGVTYQLPEEVIIRLGITDTGVEEIKSRQLELRVLLNFLNTLNDEKRKSIRDDVNKFVQQKEYQLQKAWGFKEDHRWHSWWLELPGCRCPKLDNKDARGTDYKHISALCPYHGE